MQQVNVTKAFLPPIQEYRAVLDRIWDTGQLTNGGPLLGELEAGLQEFLGVQQLQLVTNGTLALQVSLRALGISSGEVITTPFSYVATTSAVLWEGCEPVFVDIEPRTLNIDPERIERAVTPRTRAILAVHVFGIPCDTEAIESVASRHGLPVIYDAAHAFGVRHQGRSLLDYGDVTTCSFHATKLFHTIEGGCVVSRDPEVHQRVELVKRFGHTGDDHVSLGTNAKANEFQAAMGLVNLPYVREQIAARRRVSEQYDALLPSRLGAPEVPTGTERNYAYYPVLFPSEPKLQEALAALRAVGVQPRRYFWPSLNTLPYLQRIQSCPISESTAERILCLPLYPDLDGAVVTRVCDTLTSVLPPTRSQPRIVGTVPTAVRSGRRAA